MLKIEMGMGWKPDPKRPGHLITATDSDYVAEIERLRTENEGLDTVLGIAELRLAKMKAALRDIAEAGPYEDAWHMRRYALAILNQ